MKKCTAVETLVNGRRKQLGISLKELALATVGSCSTWNLRMKDPLLLKHIETQRIFRYLNFSQELKLQFYAAMDELGRTL